MVAGLVDTAEPFWWEIVEQAQATRECCRSRSSGSIEGGARRPTAGVRLLELAEKLAANENLAKGAATQN